MRATSTAVYVDLGLGGGVDGGARAKCVGVALLETRAPGEEGGVGGGRENEDGDGAAHS